MSYFSDLGLAEPLLRALETKGYADPTPIQRDAIPALLEGRDLLGIAQTGTGKTAAFSLPSLHRLASNPKPRQPASCRMLVLSPTRELAAQIADNMRGYAKYLAINVQCVFGGIPVNKQARALVPGCDVLVANDVSEGKVFGSESNSVVILAKSGIETSLSGNKTQVANAILDILIEL